MSCAYRSHRYRASVTAHPVSVSWKPPTGHAQHPIPLRPPVVRPKRQAVLATADDAPIPVSLVQYLWAQWQISPSERGMIAAVVGELMRSPHWHWHVTVLPDQSLPDPQHPFVFERDGRPMIGISIAMLRDLWRWVLGYIYERAAVLRWWAPTIDPALWQRLRAWYASGMTTERWYRLYGYLLPTHLPELVQEMHHLLSSTDPDDQQMALTVLERWMASPDSATRTLAAQMLSTWLHARPADGTVTDAHLRPRLRALTIHASDTDPPVICAHLYHLLRTARNQTDQDAVQAGTDLLDGRGAGRSLAMGRWMSLLGEMVRDHPSDDVIYEVLDRIMPTILSSVRPDDRVAWAATLWDLMTDSTLSERRRQTIATALAPMMQEPMVAALVYAQLCTEPSLHRTIPTSICNTLLASLIQTAHADAVLSMIAQAIRQDPDAIAQFDLIVAAGWGNGHDHRILQIIDSVPGPHWHTVLTEGITASVGEVVCDRIRSWFPRDQAITLIANHIHAREERGDWPLAPLPAYLIPWVGEAVRNRPSHLHPTTIRRLWLTNPDDAWNVTQTMLDSDDPSVQQRAIAAMDAGWSTWHDVEVATTLRARILERQDHRNAIETEIATVVAGLGAAPPPIMESLLTELAMKGNVRVQRQLISALHRGWGRGQDALMMRIVEMIAKRDSSERVWGNARATLEQAWDYHPPHVVGSLVDWLVTRAMNRLAQDGPGSPLTPREVQQIIAAFAPIWTHLPTAQVIERIAHHVAHLHAHARTLNPYSRDTLVSAWASVVTAGAARLSASTIHALLSSLWTLSPDWCLDGMKQQVRR